MPKLRTFRDFLEVGGTNAIREWLDGLPIQAKARINALLLRLEVDAPLQMPYTRALVGPCAGLIELRVKAGNVQYRPLMCFGPGSKEVTILFGAEERNDRLVPSSACEIALKRKELIGDGERTCEHDFGN